MKTLVMFVLMVAMSGCYVYTSPPLRYAPGYSQGYYNSGGGYYGQCDPVYGCPQNNNGYYGGNNFHHAPPVYQNGYQQQVVYQAPAYQPATVVVPSHPGASARPIIRPVVRGRRH